MRKEEKKEVSNEEALINKIKELKKEIENLKNDKVTEQSIVKHDSCPRCGRADCCSVK